MIVELDINNRIVIPKLIREALGIENNGKVKLTLEDDKLIITKPKNK